MRIVEQYMIDRCNPRYVIIDEAAFKSKNLYNIALYKIRQSFIHEGKYLIYNEMQRQMQPLEAYKVLQAKVSQQILMVLDRKRNPIHQKPVCSTWTCCQCVTRIIKMRSTRLVGGG